MSTDRAPTQGMVRLVEAKEVFVRARKAFDGFMSVKTTTSQLGIWQPDTEKQDIVNEGQRNTVG